MPKPYKTASKRIIHRSDKGRFRKSTLADIGGGCCEKCGRLYALDMDAAKSGPFIDPFKVAQIKKLCPECRPK